MTIRKHTRILILMMTGILLGALVACSPQAPDSNSADAAASVNNDTVQQGEETFVTDPEAGKVITPVQSNPKPLEAGDTAAPEGSVGLNPDLLAAVTGVQPTIPHGETNGTDCVSCHALPSATNPLPRSHTEAGLTNDYCRNCHQDA